MRDIEAIMKESKTVAVVGLSPRPERDSHEVAAYLKEQGYRIIPVNPNAEEILGEKCYPNLSAVPDPVDIVDIFRRSDDVPPIVDEAIEQGARAIWMQLNIIHQEAAQKAEAHGLDVVMDRCTKIEHEALKRRGRLR